MGYIVACDLSGNWLWGQKIYKVSYDKTLEADVQDIYIDTIYLKDHTLYIRDERRRLFAMDVKTRQIANIR